MCTRSGFDDLLQEEQYRLQPLTRDPLLMHTCAIRAPAEQLDNSGERMLSLTPAREIAKAMSHCDSRTLPRNLTKCLR